MAINSSRRLRIMELIQFDLHLGVKTEEDVGTGEENCKIGKFINCTLR